MNRKNSIFLAGGIIRCLVVIGRNGGGQSERGSAGKAGGAANCPISGAATSQLRIAERSNYIRRVAGTMEMRQTV